MNVKLLDKDSLVSWWTGGNIYTNSAVDRNGLHAGVILGSIPIEQGLSGGSFSFNGNASNYISVGNYADYRSSSFTIDILFKFSALTNGMLFDCETTSDYYGYYVSLYNNVVYFEITGNSYAVTLTPSINKWYRMQFMVSDSNTYFIFLDGILNRTGSTKMSFTSTVGFVIGRRSPLSSMSLNGVINHLLYYNKIFTAKQIAANYNSKKS